MKIEPIMLATTWMANQCGGLFVSPLLFTMENKSGNERNIEPKIAELWSKGSPGFIFGLLIKKNKKIMSTNNKVAKKYVMSCT
jgi:hypothetical protein